MTVCAADGGYQVRAHWTLPGPTGFDYLTLNASGSKLFISRGTQVDVIDTQNGTLLGTIPDTEGVHGIALDERSGRGYTSNGRSDTVTMFDLKDFKVLKKSGVSGQNPDAILFDPDGHHVFTFNGRSKDVSVLSANDLKEVVSIRVPDKPEFAVYDGEGYVFVNIESKAGQIAVIDAKKLTVQAVWPLPGCASPSGLAIDRVNRRLFSVCDDKVMVVTNASTGAQVAKLVIGEGPDAAAYDAKQGLVFSSNGEGSLSIVKQESKDSYKPIETVQTRRGARTMALDTVRGEIYVVSPDFAPAQGNARPAGIPGTFTVLKLSP
jgi:DNA-binding beta-propeller fold protein YncE